MRVTLEGKEYDFDTASIRNDEAIAIETALGCTFKQWSQQLQDFSVSALTALVWIIRRREEPGLRFGDVTFELGSLHIEDDDADPTSPEESGN